MGAFSDSSISTLLPPAWAREGTVVGHRSHPAERILPFVPFSPEKWVFVGACCTIRLRIATQSPEILPRESKKWN